MQQITDLFNDFFDKREITNERLATFSGDHLTRLNANNPLGVFDTIVANTLTVLTDFGKAYQKKGGSIGDRKGSTITKKQARKAFTDYIRQQEGAVKAKFGEQSNAYAQFFPDGLNAFNKATDTGYLSLVENISARATQYEADLGVVFKDTVIALATAYKDAEVEQATEKGDVSNTSETLTTERTDLTKQLTINALTIALQFPLQADKAGVYFETSLLFAQKRKRIFKGEPAANTTALVTKIDFEAGKFVKMKNKGAAALTFQMYLQGNAIGNSFTVTPGAEVEKKMSDFFSNADALKVTNAASLIGKYVVELIA